MLDIWVESDFYTLDSKEISIANFGLISITKRTMELQINFAMPGMITQSIKDPDELIINFTKHLIFMDSEDFE